MIGIFELAWRRYSDALVWGIDRVDWVLAVGNVRELLGESRG